MGACREHRKKRRWQGESKPPSRERNAQVCLPTPVPTTTLPDRAKTLSDSEAPRRLTRPAGFPTDNTNGPPKPSRLDNTNRPPLSRAVSCLAPATADVKHWRVCRRAPAKGSTTPSLRSSGETLPRPRRRGRTDAIAAHRRPARVHRMFAVTTVRTGPDGRNSRRISAACSGRPRRKPARRAGRSDPWQGPLRPRARG